MDNQALSNAKRLCLRAFELWKCDEQPPERFPDYWDKAVAEIEGNEAELDAKGGAAPSHQHGVVTTG